MKVEILLDRTVTIRASVHDVEFTLVLTIALVLMVVLLFLRTFWATFHPQHNRAARFAWLVLRPCTRSASASDNISLMALTIAGRLRGG